jgi:nucleotide-binding universal stress UspA family protein
MEIFVNRYFSDYPNIKFKVVVGDTVGEILQHIASEDIDITVMGTHNRKGLDRIFL